MSNDNKPAAAQKAVAYNSGGIELTACQLHEALLMAGSPELDVEFDDRSRVRIFHTDNGHSGPGLYCECVDVEEEGCILLDGTSPAIAAPVAAAPVDALEAAARRMFEQQADPLAAPWDRQWEPTKEHWRKEAAKASAAGAPGIDLSKLQRYRMASDANDVRNLYKDDSGTWVKIQDVERALIDASPKGGSDAMAWHGPDKLPDVAPGDMGWFWVAVKRANGKTYSFPASYLNGMLLSDEHGSHDEPRAGNRYSYGAADEDEGSFQATGWHSAQEHSEYDNVYMPLLSDDDELLAWLAVADFTQQATSAEVGP